MAPVLITRDPEANQKTRAAFERAGFQVILWPTFEFEAKALSAADFQILEKDHDWIVFTSARAARPYFAVARDVLQTPSFPKIAVVGMQTRRAVEQCGKKVDLVASESSGFGLTRENVFAGTQGLKILWPGARDAGSDLVSILGERHRVDSVVLYQKRALPKSESEICELEKTPVSWAVFYSPSAIRFFMEGFGSNDRALDCLKKTKLVAIGNTTARELRRHGLRAHVTGQRASTAELIALMLNFQRE